MGVWSGVLILLSNFAPAAAEKEAEEREGLLV